MVERVPVTVITGFLGAGKSTLLDRWLDELSREDTAVIINEQGEVGIDGALLAQRVTRLREITGGCICCSSALALHTALTELAALSPPPSRILVETSGAASPAGVLRAITRGDARENLRVDGVVTVVDASRIADLLRFDLTVEQLGFADIVAVSHGEDLDDAALRDVEALLKVHAPAAVMVHTSHGRVRAGTAGQLLSLLAARTDVLHSEAGQSSRGGGHGIDAVSFIHEGELDQERFGFWVEHTLGAVEARLLRIKGILAIVGVDQRVIVQGVSEAVEVSLGRPWADAPRSSRLVILGLSLDEAALRAGFARCYSDQFEA